ncbi:hypothetical protein D1AOALGA4SA_7154 [Olavius algarvensis Delta 1 endosymbiont]|nr:hypothetical protein D1AOALGA4SA_7154 [Olavius algarvensis Delta 1 endosymbiont]
MRNSKFYDFGFLSSDFGFRIEKKPGPRIFSLASTQSVLSCTMRRIPKAVLFLQP